VYAGLITSTGDLDSLPVIEAGAPAYGPLQAFTFQSGADDAQCSEAANSGMVIQTPEGVGKVTFLINEISVQLGSTLYFQAQPGGFLTASVLEGSATITAFDTVRTATAGSQITVPLSADGLVSGPPNDPVSYDLALFQGLPLAMLERAITIHEPLTPQETESVTTPQEIESVTTPPSAPEVLQEQPPEESGAPENIVICHKGKNTITISIDALDAHLAHGDTIGPCP